MKEEIAAAVFFVTRLAKRHGCLDNEGRDRFAAALTSALFDSYKNHWYPQTPSKGQAYRCLRMNRFRLRDPVLERACIKGAILYEDLGLPRELTVWVDPGEVSCRYGERCEPFCVIQLGDFHGGGEFSRRIQNAVERAALDVQSGALSDEEGGDTSMSSSCSSLSTSCPASGPTPNPEPKTIPTVSNPNSVYQLNEFAPSGPQPWAVYPKRKPFSGEGHPSHAPPGTPFSQHSSQFPPQKGYKPYRPSFCFTGPRVDKYHWVSKSRS